MTSKQENAYVFGSSFLFPHEFLDEVLDRLGHLNFFCKTRVCQKLVLSEYFQ